MRRTLAGTAAIAAAVLANAGCGQGKASETTSTRPAPATPAAPAPLPNSHDAPTTPQAPSGATAHGDSATRVLITVALRSYLTALAGDDGASACSQLAQAVQLELQGVAKTGNDASCASEVTSMFAQQTDRKRTALRHTTIDSIRLGQGQAFVTIRQPGMPLQSFPMYQEDNRWTVGALGGTILPAPAGHPTQP